MKLGQVMTIIIIIHSTLNSRNQASSPVKSEALDANFANY
jgi:hypothetical protein